MNAVFVRAAPGVTTLGGPASTTMQLDLGALVVVGATSGTQNGNNDLTVTDNLGNTYLVAVQGIANDFGQSGHAGDAQIAYTVVTHPGVATITNTSGDISAWTQVSAALYTIPSGMTLDQVGYAIGGIPVPNGATDAGEGSEPIQHSNSLHITLMRNGGFCMLYVSVDGDTKRTEIPGTVAGGHGAGGHALFDAIFNTPGIRNSSAYVTPNPQPGCSPASRSGLSNILVAVFSVALPRPTNLTSQAGVRPGKSGVTGVYNGQTSVDVGLPYMPKIGSKVFVGFATGYAGGANPVPVITVASPDAYGNIYTQLGTDSSSARQEADAIFMTTVAHLPTTGVFKATVSVPPFPDASGAAQNPKTAFIGEYFLTNPGAIQVAGFASNTNLGGGVMKLLTTSLTVAANTLIAGFGTARYTNGAPLPVAWAQDGNYALDIASNLWQVDASALSQTVRLGTGDWFHYYTVTGGSYAGATDGSLTGAAGIMIIAIPVGIGLACPIATTGTVGVFYDDFLIESGGVAPFTYAIISGALPTGLSLNTTTGEISGTPTVAGSYNYVARVTDANGLTAVTPGCPIIISAPSTLTVACPLLQSGTVGNPYIGFVQASGGVPPYTFTVLSGSLPPGFTLDPVTGMITGTAAIVGSYSFVIQVTDSIGATATTGTCPISITICTSAKSLL